MGDRFGGKSSWYVTSHPGQLSLAIPPWVGAMSASIGWEGNCDGHASQAMVCVMEMSILPVLLRSMPLL